MKFIVVLAGTGVTRPVLVQPTPLDSRTAEESRCEGYVRVRQDEEDAGEVADAWDVSPTVAAAGVELLSEAEHDRLQHGHFDCQLHGLVHRLGSFLELDTQPWRGRDLPHENEHPGAHKIRVSDLGPETCSRLRKFFGQ
eukprot:2077640-Rhodomonas_salina.1